MSHVEPLQQTIRRVIPSNQQVQIRVSPRAHEWLKERAKATGNSIPILIEDLIFSE